MLAETKQQFRATRFEPGVRGVDRGDRGDEFVDRVGFSVSRGQPFERFAARMQRKIDVDVPALLECARRRRERNLLILKHTEIGQHELRPVLLQIAEEHQAQTLAKRRDGDVENAVGGLAVPCGQRMRSGASLLALALTFVKRPQRFQQIGFAQALRAGNQRDGVREDQLQLGTGGERKQIVERQTGFGIDPAERCQGRNGLQRATDFIIRKTAGTEQRALPHQHANQQRAGGLWQNGEIAQEAMFVRVQQIVVTLGEPRQRTLEVQQVIKDIRTEV
jgi:hypothetical protein